MIAGIAKGHTLIAPKGMKTRPTQDRVREAIFNVLAVRIPGSRVLDLFAGSGALGIEALSRGAAFCVFSDWDKQAIRAIEDNLKRTKFTDNASIYNSSAERLLDFLQAKQEVFDLVFLDPPYESGVYERILDKLLQHGLLANGATIVAESSCKLELRKQYASLTMVKQTRYGDTLVSYYEKMEE